MKYNIVIDDSAYDKAKSIYKESKEILRISVKGGGCSGFEYEYSTSQYPDEKDIIFQRNETQILIDDISIKYLKDSNIKFVQTIGSSKFVIDNPNVSGKCGCGNSFDMT